jgi:hypothetical protein
MPLAASQSPPGLSAGDYIAPKGLAMTGQAPTLQQRQESSSASWQLHGCEVYYFIGMLTMRYTFRSQFFQEVVH